MTSSQSVRIVALLIPCLWSCISTAQVEMPTSNSKQLQFAAADDIHFSDTSGTAIVPEEGMVAVVGIFDDASFAISGENEITVIDPQGNHVELTIAKRSILREFDDNVISLRFCFMARRQDLAPGRKWLVEWGPNVSAGNSIVETFHIPSEHDERCMEFTWNRNEGISDGSTSIASIEVIADSNANLYALWYLLPLAVVFGLLTIRKISRRGADA